MAMHLKDQQQRSQLQSRITRDLDKQLTKPRGGHSGNKVAATTHHIAPSHNNAILSLRGAWFTVLVTGGCVAILIALLERENPAAISGTLEARSLALLGVAAIVLGCLGLLFGRILDRKRGHS